MTSTSIFDCLSIISSFFIFFVIYRSQPIHHQEILNSSMNVFIYHIEDKLYIATPFRNEGIYLEEWLVYHIQIGFDRIYLIDDNDEGNNYDQPFINKIKSSPFLSKYVIFIQNLTQKDFSSLAASGLWDNLKKNEWLFLNLNIDEFLTFSNNTLFGKNIKEYIENAKKRHCDVICINWMVYGNNGHHYYHNGSVLKRFPLPVQPFNFRKFNRIENSHTKCIGHGGLGVGFSAHDIFVKSNQLRCNADLAPKTKSQPFVYSSAFIRHYFSKSDEEWFNKKMKRHQKKIKKNNYDWNDFNEVNKYYPNEPHNDSFQFI